MTFQQAFQQAVLMSCTDAIPSVSTASTAPVSAPDERQFVFTTRYRKSHAALTWTIDDYAIRESNEEKLQVEFTAGDGADETKWKLQCFFGSCHDDHKGELICKVHSRHGWWFWVSVVVVTFIKVTLYLHKNTCNPEFVHSFGSFATFLSYQDVTRFSET